MMPVLEVHEATTNLPLLPFLQGVRHQGRPADTPSDALRKNQGSWLMLQSIVPPCSLTIKSV